MTTPPPEPLVLDARAVVEALLGSDLGIKARARMRGHELHAPAHLDAEVLSALGRLHRARELDEATMTVALRELAAALRALTQDSPLLLMETPQASRPSSRS